MYGKNLKKCGQVTHTIIILVVTAAPGYLDWRLEHALRQALDQGRLQTVNERSTLVLTGLPPDAIEYRPRPLDPCNCPLEYQYEGSCGIFRKKSDNWCDDICCAHDEDDCCDLEMKVVVGIPVAGFVLLCIAVVSSCYFCSCCCWFYRLHGRGGGAFGDQQECPSSNGISPPEAPIVVSCE